MKTVGNIIKEARRNKNISIKELANLTHIKADFIKGIEKGDWKTLPEIAVVIGFVKTISHFLDVDERRAVSFLRREYPPELQKKLIPKSENFEKKFIWGPRLTFLAGVLIIISLVLGYLGFQYRKFNASPSLTINSPKQNEVITSSSLNVSGKTDPDAVVLVNNQPVIVASDGSFSAQINVDKNTTQVTIISTSRSGRKSDVERKIKVEL